MGVGVIFSREITRLLAEQLIRAGFNRVRVLTGGTDAIAALSGYSSNP